MITGADVKMHRQRLGLTQVELGSIIGVSVPAISRWENGHARVSRLAQRALQHVFVRLTPAIGENENKSG